MDGANLTISAGQKVAVIGRNGAGKSTLFRLIMGEEEPSGGEIMIHGCTRIGYLTQHSPFEEDESVMDFLTRFSGKESWVCAKTASRFQVKADLFERMVTSLPGGYQMRVKLIAMLAKEPNLLLLDEPTNFLDLSTLLLLENFLRNYNAAFMLISHDREFIKKTCEQTLEIDHGKTVLFPQPLDEYLLYKAEKLETIEKFNKKVIKEKEHLQTFVDRFKSKASKATQAKSKMKQIDKLKTIDIVHPMSTSKIRIPKIIDKKGSALTVEDMEIGYSDKSVASHINFNVERGEHVALLGDNGQGKTTLLKTIAGELTALGGGFRWGSNMRVGYYAQHTPGRLRSVLTVKDYLIGVAGKDVSLEEVLEMAGNFLFKGDALDKEISVLSGGEKARLCLAVILLQKNHVLLLDEPTNHLDFETVEALASALAEYNGTIVFVSHNRSFVDTLATGIIEIKDGKAKRYYHNYEDYVFHIRSAIEADLQQAEGGKKAGGARENADGDAGRGNPKIKNPKLLLRKARNELRRLESAIKKLEEEKSELTNWFGANPGKYSEEKSSRLGAVLGLLEAAENDWLKTQSEIERLG